MKVTIDRQPGAALELIIRCADPDDPKVTELLRLTGNLGKKIPANHPGDLFFLDPQEVFYGEFVGRTVFLYTAQAVFPTGCTLAQLERDYNGFLRCSKSMVVNLLQIQRLKSEISGRILATLRNGEQILISRHYASILREALNASR